MKSFCVQLISLSVIFSINAQNLENDQRLKKALERYPEADKNKDGILTVEEAMAFRREIKSVKKKKISPPNTDISLFTKKILNLKYGEHDRNVIDLWLVKSDKPTPLMIYIHGGGFKGGDKSKGYKHIEGFLEKGISFASINYRFMPDSGIGVRGSLNDSKRALQFLRYKASEFNLDKTKFGCMGDSAGAGTTFWLAFTDDMANPLSKDPVERESTRITVAAGFGAQCTYNIQRWKEVMDVVGEGDESDLLAFYGFKSIEEMNTEKGQKVIANLDMLGLLTKDDPPFYVMNTQPGGIVDIKNKGHLYHHANHAKALKERALEVGVEHLCFASKIGIQDSPDSNVVNFALKHFNH